MKFSASDTTPQEESWGAVPTSVWGWSEHENKQHSQGKPLDYRSIQPDLYE